MIKIHFDELPRVASGKFSKKQLRDDFVAIEQHSS
jgi:acyl-CoA synthetase (AMP-forming)/AMP-acid ligase II